MHAGSDAGAPFQALQRRFASHLRDPRRCPPPPGIEERRLAIYRDLFYRNIESLLANNFPVLKALLGEQRWHALVRDFYARHRAHTPQFPRLGQELLAYLEHERDGVPGADDDPPFLLELAHYEWVEGALAIEPRAADEGLGAIDPDGDLMAGVPVLSRLAWPLAYRFPVHRIGPDFGPREPPPEPTWLLVHRDRAAEVHFTELNAVSARLIELVAAEPAPGHALLERIAAELGHPRPPAVLEHGAALLERWRELDVILGTRRAGESDSAAGRSR